MSSEEASAPKPVPEFWCDVCRLDLQSEATLTEHCDGKKHRKRAGTYVPSVSDRLPAMSSEEFLMELAAGRFRNVVVLTGAGISTAAGIPDFRSAGSGMFQKLSEDLNDRFPFVKDAPEALFSRSFVSAYSQLWNDELLPRIRAFLENREPTLTHRFCADLHRKGLLRRIYTQNIDGLHKHGSLGVPERKVVECHGSIQSDNLLLYEDPLPKEFFKMVIQDFDNTQSEVDRIDLLLVMGTSLQVAPFCAIPNLAPRLCTRVLVNRSIDGVVRNGDSAVSETSFQTENSVRIGSRKRVPLRSLWCDRKASKKWRQILVQEDCDHFAKRYFEASGRDV